MTKKEAFEKLPVLQPTDRILLISHNDLDGSGPVVILNTLFDKNSVTVMHVGNGAMSWKIRNAIVYDDNSMYDKIIICDVSCNEKDAEVIDKSPNKDKVILLDHHGTAKHLNDYAWAYVGTEILEDSFRYTLYPEDKKSEALSSGTSLLYDYLDYYGYFDQNASKFKLRVFTHRIACLDTWDWVNVFGSDEIYRELDILFDIYGQDTFDDVFSKRMYDFNDPLIMPMDQRLLDIEKTKIEKHVSNVSKVIQTGNILIDDTYYSIVFCHAEAYLLQTFEYMKEAYPDYDLYLIDYGLGLSFRTVSDNIDVGMMLKKFGGGGHPGAGGIRYSLENRTTLMEATLGNSKIIFDEKERPY